MGKKSRSGSGMKIPDQLSESLEQSFGLKVHKLFDVDPDPGSGVFFDPGSGMEKFGSGTNIQDP